MDAAYLRNNINAPLAEALSSMVQTQPADGIEYIGKYLLQYVERQEMVEADALENARIEEGAELEVKKEERDKSVKADAAFVATKHAEKLPKFIEELCTTATSKADVMERVTNFTTDYIKVPACYVGIVKKTGETECLHYFGACKGQEHVLGAKLPKPTEEGEDAPTRQGIAFNAFKIPEVVEEEAPPLEEGQEPPPPKPAPKAEPLVVDNVMRNTGVRFFGIPKIGSFAAVPITYSSLDHEAVAAPGSDANGKVPCNVLLCVDTIGKYRQLTGKDVEVCVELGKAVAQTFEALEGAMFEKHHAFMNEYKAANANAASLAGKVGEAEGAAVAAATAALPAECADSLKAWKEAEAALSAWTTGLCKSDGFVEAVTSLNKHLLPAPQAVSNLFYAAASVCGMTPKDTRDVCGDITWEATRCSIVGVLPDAMSAYDVNAKAVPASKENSLAALKKFTEDNNVFDASAYPPHLSVCGPLSMWVQKAIAARAAAVAHHMENDNGNNLEVA